MYRDLWEVYRLNGTKKDMPNFVAKCRNCKKVKAEYLKFGSFVSRYRNSHLDVRRGLYVFFYGLACTRRQHNSIMVIVDRIIKSCHSFSYLVEDYAKLCIEEEVRLHGVPLSIISDRGTQFTS